MTTNLGANYLDMNDPFDITHTIRICYNRKYELQRL